MTSRERTADPIAVWTLLVVAVLALGAAWRLPWWRMEARAPQYGQRVLVVEVAPTGVSGDVHELDTLGHYVGIHPLGGLARLERGAAPIALAIACAGLLLAPWVRRRFWRALLLLPVIAMPALFLADVDYWMRVGTNDRDPHAALNLTVTRIETKVIGQYAVGQFHVDAELASGLFGAGTAALIALGLIFVAPLPPPRRRRSGRTAAAVVTLAALLISLGGAAGAAEQTSEGAIARAIAAAAPGDVVLVPAGVHHEHLVIAKAITLRGLPGAILDGDDRDTVVRIEAPGVALEDLTIRRSGDDYDREDAGVRIQHASGVRLSRVRIEDTLFGLFAAQADRCVVERSTVIGKDLPDTRRGDGIRLWYSSGCRIVQNRIERSRDVVIWFSSNTLVEGNQVRRGRYGLHYMYSNHNCFRGNVFEDNQVGAAIMNSRDITLDGNAFSFSDGPSGYGLLLKDADDVFITGNRFVGDAIALFFDGAPQSRGGRVEVHGNLIARNRVGLALEPRSRGVRIWENALIGNQLAVELEAAGDAEGDVWAVAGRGNYWSDAVVYDPDGDGVSNLPYRMESTWEALADRYPTLGFFWSTPAADAIDLGARLFPLYRPRPKLTDPAPLTRPPLSAWLVSGGRARRGGMAEAGVGLIGVGMALVFWARRARA